jgi:hypothetical protein
MPSNKGSFIGMSILTLFHHVLVGHAIAQTFVRHSINTESNVKQGTDKGK